MFPIVDNVTSTHMQSGSQALLVNSVTAHQKVLAAQSGSASGGAGNQMASDTPWQNKTPRKTQDQTPNSETGNFERTEQARSVFEAQDMNRQAEKIKAAFMARREMHELLSIIRDPEDRILPDEPDDLAK